jgi:NitT/TauT family transport system substrate-binding protein
MKRKLNVLLSVIMVLFVFVGCGTTANEESNEVVETKEIKVVVPDGLPSMGIAKMIKENPEILSEYNVSYSIERTPENIVSAVLKGEVDIAVVPSNVAATQYNKEAGYKIAATTGWGSFYLISADGEKTIDDLKGQEIYNIGRGLTPDIVTKSVLKDMGYNPDSDFNFSYVNGVTELAPMILAGKTKYAVVPEPALSQILSKNPDVKVVMELNEEWKNNNSSEYGFPQATIIVKEDLIGNDSEFVEEFLNKVEESTVFANENTEELANYCEEIGVSADKAIIPKAMDKANIKFVKIKDSYEEYKTYFNKLNEFDPSTIGGKVPDEGVFMEK